MLDAAGQIVRQGSTGPFREQEAVIRLVNRPCPRGGGPVRGRTGAIQQVPGGFPVLGEIAGGSLVIGGGEVPGPGRPPGITIRDEGQRVLQQPDCLCYVPGVRRPP